MSAPTLYRCLVEEQTEDEAFIQVYWSHGDHIGVAIENILSTARRNGLNNPQPRNLDPYDIGELQRKVEPSPAAETFWAPERVFFDPEPLFVLPYGIIGSCKDGEHGIDEIASGFTRQKDAEGKTTIEVNLTSQALLPVYAMLLRLKSSYAVFWYLLHDHWDHSADHFLVNESLVTPDAILNHMRTHELDSIMNGYVTITSYLKEGATNLNVSDHKRIIVFTYSDELADRYCAELNNAGYPQMNELVAIDHNIHHWHYRHPKSRSRRELVKHLHSIGFRDWTPR